MKITTSLRIHSGNHSNITLCIFTVYLHGIQVLGRQDNDIDNNRKKKKRRRGRKWRRLHEEEEEEEKVEEEDTDNEHEEKNDEESRYTKYYWS